MGHHPLDSPFLTGGYELDPDLPVPDDDNSWHEALGMLHILRHAERYLRSIGKELVLVDGSEGDAWYDFVAEYSLDEEESEALRRPYRVVTSPDRIRAVVRHEPDAAPLLYIEGGGCTGWREPAWSGVRLARCFAPGQLFLLFVRKVPTLGPRPNAKRKLQVHLLEWQHPFPEHSVATWTSHAELLPEPQPIPDREDVAFIIHSGHSFGYSDKAQRRRRDWWDDVERRPGLSVVR